MTNKKNKILIPKGSKIIRIGTIKESTIISNKDFKVDVHQIKGHFLYYFIENTCYKVSKYAINFLSILLIIFFTSNCFASSRDIKELNSSIQSKLNTLIEKAKEKNIEFKITCTYRSQEEQNALYAKGRTSPGKKITWTKNSIHTQRKAFDIAIIKNNKISWKGEDYLEIGELGKSIGLTWGGDWKVKDYCHFQLD